MTARDLNLLFEGKDAKASKASAARQTLNIKPPSLGV